VKVKIKNKVKFRVRIRSRVKIRVRIRAGVEVRVRVRVSVSYIMTIWRWEEFSRCNKFPMTPEVPVSTPAQCTALGKLFTHVCLCHQAVQFVTGLITGK